MKTVLLLLACVAGAPAHAADDLAWQRGQSLYRHGWDGQAPCVRCHGVRGEGRQEGGLRAPALAEKTGPEYLQLALVKGQGGTGENLHPLMPRYRIDAAQLDDLRAYLAVIGSDVPGLNDSFVRVGVALPPTVYGAAVQAGLSEAFGEVEVYGRRLQLVVNPVPDKVFVEVGNLATQASAEATSPEDGPPVIGPLPVPGMAAFIDPAAQNRVFFLPDLLEQSTMLFAQATLEHPEGTTPPQFLLVYEAADNPSVLTRVATLRELARSQQRSMREQVGTNKPPLAGEVVIFLGDGVHLRDFLAAGGSAPVYASAIEVGPEALNLPLEQAARLRLLLPWQATRNSFTLADAYHDAAYASGLILVEVLKRCGRRMERAQLLQQIGSLRNLPVHAFGSLDFHPGQQHGGHAAQLLTVDAQQGMFSVLREMP